MLFMMGFFYCLEDEVRGGIRERNLADVALEEILKARFL